MEDKNEKGGLFVPPAQRSGMMWSRHNVEPVHLDLLDSATRLGLAFVFLEEAEYF
jgi:hypothetical protein